MALTECLAGRELPDAAVASVREWVGAVSTELHATLDDGQRKGYFRDDFDRDAVVELIVGSAVGSALIRAGGRTAGHATAPQALVLGRLVSDYCGWK